MHNKHKNYITRIFIFALIFLIFDNENNILKCEWYSERRMIWTIQVILRKASRWPEWMKTFTDSYSEMVMSCGSETLCYLMVQGVYWDG